MARTEEENSDGGGRRRGVVAAGAFLACLVVLGGLVVLTTGDDDPAPPPRAGGTDQRKGDGDGQCPDSPDAVTAVPTEAPDGVTWEVYRTVVVPTSQTAGPHVVEDDVARCYAHTPTGALLAAAQITIRSSLAKEWRPVVAQQVTGSGVEDLRQALRRIELSGQSIQPGTLGQFAGFRFITYDQDLAVVDLVTRRPDGGLRAVPATVRWSDSADDWQLQVPVAGGHSIDSLDGYVTWGGV